jgi:hypothetical protein
MAKAAGVQADDSDAQDAAAAAVEEVDEPAAAESESDEGTVKLFYPQIEGLVFGANSEIKFGPRGFFEPHVWVGPANHPLLEEMMRRHPGIEIVGKPKQVFMCGSCTPPREFKTLAGWQAHQRVHKGGVTPR